MMFDTFSIIIVGMNIFSHYSNSSMQFLLGVNKDQSTLNLDFIQFWLIRCYYTYSRKVND